MFSSKQPISSALLLTACHVILTWNAQSAPVIAEGLVTPEKQVELAAPSEGLLREVLVKEGSHVSKDDPIARLASEEEQIRVQQAELQARKLQNDFQAAKRLFESKAASRDELDNASIAAEGALAARNLLKILLDNRTVSAPISGHIVRIYKNPGESVQRLEKVAELVSLDRKLVIVYLDATYFGKIQRGMKISVAPPADAPALEGTVDVVDPVLDAGGRSFRIKVLVDDPKNLLAVGTRTQVTIPVP